MAAEGIQCEVIDPRTLQPFDIETVLESVRRTNHAVVVHEAVRFGGLGGEIAAQIQEDAFDYLDIKGRDGLDLATQFRENGVETYMGMTIHGFPNLYFMLGPNTALGHNSVVFMIEQQTNLLRVGDRPHQSGGPIRVPRVDVGVTVDQHLHGVQRADFGGNHQQRDSIGSFRVCADTLIQKRLYVPQVVGADRRIQPVIRLVGSRGNAGYTERSAQQKYPGPHRATS